MKPYTAVAMMDQQPLEMMAKDVLNPQLRLEPPQPLKLRKRSLLRKHHLNPLIKKKKEVLPVKMKHSDVVRIILHQLMVQAERDVVLKLHLDAVLIIFVLHKAPILKVVDVKVRKNIFNVNHYNI